MSGCVCTRWTSLHCRGRRILSKSCYSVSPSTRCVWVPLPCSWASQTSLCRMQRQQCTERSCSLPQSHDWCVLSPDCWWCDRDSQGAGRRKKLILCSGKCHALISSPANPEDWAAKTSWTTVTGHVFAIIIRQTWGKTCWLKFKSEFTHHLSDMGWWCGQQHCFVFSWSG